MWSENLESGGISTLSDFLVIRLRHTQKKITSQCD